MIILGVVFIVAIILYVVFRLLKRGQIEEHDSIVLDEKNYKIILRFGSKLPKLLSASATTIALTICFRAYPRNLRMIVSGVNPISTYLVCHELYHVVDRIRSGPINYWFRIWKDIIFHPFNHNARQTEIDAEAAAERIQLGLFKGLDATDLIRRFA